MSDTASGKAGGLPRGVPILEKGQVFVRMSMEVTAVLEQATEAEWVKFFGAAFIKHGQRLIDREIYPPPPPAHKVEREHTYLLMVRTAAVEHLVPVNIAFYTRKTAACGLVEEVNQAPSTTGERLTPGEVGLGCSAHRNYQAKRAPTSGCTACCLMWNRSVYNPLNRRD